MLRGLARSSHRFGNCSDLPKVSVNGEGLRMLVPVFAPLLSQPTWSGTAILTNQRDFHNDVIKWSERIDA